jgi:hypothetical protein
VQGGTLRTDNQEGVGEQLDGIRARKLAPTSLESAHGFTAEGRCFGKALLC